MVADLSLSISIGGSPSSTSLLNKNCGPKEADDTRALFSFPLHTCGSIIKVEQIPVKHTACASLTLTDLSSYCTTWFYNRNDCHYLYPQLGRGNVTYQNEIFYNKNNAVSTDATERYFFALTSRFFITMSLKMTLSCKCVLVFQGDSAVYISSGWSPSPLLILQV